ncbi:hypothetical protein [Cellulomonas marina]|uniref:hypothetical protein n=1 Tax=Cellulomonas marina TaxID=988821 RepID=UPI001940CEDE|nr:hypothetical protein [Cellulomonas marina]
MVFGMLDRDVRGRLRTLTKENADVVGRHLVMVARLLDDDPEAAYAHATAAVVRGGRVDVVREAAGLAAYRTGRWAEALRELRTVRRLNGSSEHLPVMADCERGLGRPERALALAHDEGAAGLDPAGRVELAMVVSGARLDLGEPDAALAALGTPEVRAAGGVLGVRVAQARATALEAAGRAEEAAAELAGFDAAQLAAAGGRVDDDDDLVVWDLADEDDEQDGRPAGEPDDEQDGQPAGEPDDEQDDEQDGQPADEQPDEVRDGQRDEVRDGEQRGQQDADVRGDEA